MIVAVVAPWRSLQYHAHWDRIRWLPFVSAPITARDIIGNLLLYLPFGYFGYSHFTRRAWPVLVASVLLSCVTEFAQIFGHYRFPSAQDVMMNVAGAAIGVVLVISITRARVK